MGLNKQYKHTLLPNGVAVITGSGPPASGAGTLFAQKGYGPGSRYTDSTNSVEWINEGTSAAPYWSPSSYDQPGIFGVVDDFRSETGKAVTDTAAALTLESGLRIFGQGAAEAADSGGVVTAGGEGGGVMVISTTDEAAHTIALGTDAIFQPDQHGILVIDVELAHVTAITDRATFVGFLGTAADALDPAVTGATTTLTLVQDDLAGAFQDSGLTDADGWFAPHNKSNEAASIATTATGVDLSTTMAAAGTYQRMRVEISAAGAMKVFVDKVLKTTIAASLDVNEEAAAVVYLESNAAAGKSMNVRNFRAYAVR